MSFLDSIADFIGSTITEREVEYKGKTRTFRFRELQADEAEKIFLNVHKDPAKNLGVRNRLLAATLVNADGTQACTAADIGKLPNELVSALQNIALDVNGLGAKAEDEGKNE